MPRWRALPEELDPQVKEFASQLRRLVERSGLSLAAVADRTGYSKTSWERYLNGRLLPPQRAVVALAEATGAHAGHLTTMWELAERAWSRSEMRHDVTMEAIRVAQARAALGEFGPAPGKAKSRFKDKVREKAQEKAQDRAKGKAEDKAGAQGEREPGQAPGRDGAPRHRGDELPSSADFPGLAEPPAAAAPPAAAPSAPPSSAPDASAGAPPDASPGVPPGVSPVQPAAGADGDADRPDKVSWPRVTAYVEADPVGPPPRYDAPPYGASPPDASRAGVSGTGTPRPDTYRPDTSRPDASRPGAGSRPAGPAAGHLAGAPASAGPPDATDRQLRRRRVTMFLAGVVGALLVIAAAVLLLDTGGEGGGQAAPTPSASPSKKPVLPAGVKCAGSDCAGKDPEAMGCGGRNADSPARGFAGGTLIEVRYSKVCGAAWARITGAAPGDEAAISSAGRTEKARAGRDGDAYTAMVPVSGDPKKVTACGTTAAGAKGCAKPVPTGAGAG
ncbi:helix-turn-helix domain-containing protein [Streptomyces sp. NPDC018019]|uniref:helix-turn-helix domain-containing protein n=1 Tax=Streptomyces sp. NPDC018019 TaxID=3365030 RepID=UPI0037B86B43